MSTLEKLVKEHEAIQAAQERVQKRRAKLMKKLQDHRGAVVAIDGEVYSVSGDTSYPEVKHVGVLTDD